MHVLSKLSAIGQLFACFVLKTLIGKVSLLWPESLEHFCQASDAALNEAALRSAINLPPYLQRQPTWPTTLGQAASAQQQTASASFALTATRGPQIAISHTWDRGIAAPTGTLQQVAVSTRHCIEAHRRHAARWPYALAHHSNRGSFIFHN